MNDDLDVLVIGAGQAGLVMGYHLKERGLRFEIVDAGWELGSAWRSRWDSLRLFTPAQYDNMPGMAFPASLDTYPSKDDVADFLQSYAQEFELPVRLKTKVTSLTRSDDHYVAETSVGPLEARQVVVATGPFHIPFVPSISSDFDSSVTQIHSTAYRRPDSIPAGKVLVVGAANTGCQIALELVATRSVDISVGQRLPTIAQRPLGHDVWWWGTGVGLTRITAKSRIGKRLSGRDQVIGGGLRELRRRGVVVRPRTTAVTGRSVMFADGESSEYDAVIWATGFRLDHSWINIPDVKNANGLVMHERGVVASPGLYMLGQTWQHTRTSALLGWVARDAAFLMERISSVTEPRVPTLASA